MHWSSMPCNVYVNAAIQWYLSTVDTVGTQLAALYREVCVDQRYRFVLTSM